MLYVPIHTKFLRVDTITIRGYLLDRCGCNKMKCKPELTFVCGIILQQSVQGRRLKYRVTSYAHRVRLVLRELKHESRSQMHSHDTVRINK